MEDFMAQVAWPGVQPSSTEGGEVPTAQEPQLEETPWETPKDTPAATPMEVPNKEDGASETNIDTDYVADVTVAQGTWDPWPTTSQDTPMPAQDAPTSPKDNPAPTQDDWWQDSIYLDSFKVVCFSFIYLLSTFTAFWTVYDF